MIDIPFLKELEKIFLSRFNSDALFVAIGIKSRALKFCRLKTLILQ